MRVYLYDSVTGEYMGIWDCYKDPECESETGFLVPEYSTAINPNAKKGTVSFFKNGAWSDVEDNRGTQLWSTETGQQVEITELGPLPENITDIEKPTDGTYLWSDGAWVKQPETYICNAWQFRAAANKLHLLLTIENYIKTASFDIQLAWGYSPSFSNTNATLLKVAQAIGKTQADVDELIQLGMSLNP